jgi:sugar phosphate isomerase/epimerase
MMKATKAFAKWSKEIRSAGKRFGYHIHSQEFGPAPGGGTLFDKFAEELGPEVGFEMDVFWVVSAGIDPLVLMKKYPGRIWYTHLKDMTKGNENGEDAKVVLGTGKIDIAGIVKGGEAAGVQIHYLEDESRDPMGQIPQSAAFYKTLKI